ncbi:MAG: phenylacetate--CoA ligase family protein [Rhizobiales bacterium]|nr:phenylacetate--CoA ligase family protein [Hyphomicrobiales bacterium]
MALGDLADLQADRWAQQSDYVSAHSEFYRRHLHDKPLPSALAALQDVPFTDKEMLRADQAEHGPFGSYLAANPDAIMRLHRTSGTTGTAMNLALSERDAEMTAVVGARAQGAAGLGPGHRVVHCLNYQLWMGGYSDHAILERTGATVVPFGVGNSAKLVRTILELGITAISCTPSYPAVLEQVIADGFPDLTPRDLGLQLGLFGGEAGLDDLAYRARLEGVWGFAARNANYGVSDVLCNFAAQTATCMDLHFMALDVLYPELIDPVSEAPLPWQEGQSGELVLTHLAKECQPLVRFKTGDIITLTGLGLAECGRTAPRFRVTGRADDMVTVRGLNVFPAMVAGVVNQFEQLSGEYRIVLAGSPPHDVLPVEVELAEGVQDADAAPADAVERKIKQETGAAAKVTVRPPRSLPRTEGKTKRVIREGGQDV